MALPAPKFEFSDLVPVANFGTGTRHALYQVCSKHPINPSGT